MLDLRYAVRLLLKDPGFTAIAVLALALGIGANTAIFTVVNAILLRPLPYPNPDRIVMVARRFRAGTGNTVSLPKFDYWRRNARCFDAIAMTDFAGGGYNLAGDEPERLRGIRVTSDFFSVTGIQPALGRGFNAADDQPNSARTAVLAHRLWQRRFAGDPNVIGRTVRLNGEAVTIIGVMPRAFHAYPEAEVWLAMQPVIKPDDKANYLLVLARLRPGITRQQAEAEMTGVSQRLREENKRLMIDGETVALTPLQEQLTGDVRPALLILLGAVAAVLLIACANVANLLLARAAGRQREVAIRLSLGASRGRLVRQLLIESTLLGLTAGMFGLALGYSGVRVLQTAGAAKLPLMDITMDAAVLGFTLGLAVLTGIVFGLVPAFHASQPNLTETLKEGSRSATGGSGRSRTRRLLVIGEIAIALVLVICAGLLLETFIRLRNVDAGFDAPNVLTFQLSLSGPRFEMTAQVETFERQVLQRIEAVPGITAAACATNLPLETGPSMPFAIEGDKDTGLRPDVQWRAVTPHYFAALGIRLRKGRAFTENDTAASTAVIIVNEALAKRYFQSQDPIGRQITIGKGLGPRFEDKPRQIVGIAANVREVGLDREPPATMYLPWPQMPDRMTELIFKVLPTSWTIRTAGEPMTYLPAVRAEIRAVEHDNPVANPRTMEQVMAESIDRQNFNMAVLAVFAALALVLAAVGIYGVMAYSVTQRTHEIGIRMALGAGRAEMARMVVRQGMTLAGAGIAVGLVAAYFATRLLGGLLYGVPPGHLPTFAVVAGLTAAVALAAGYLPAMRATRVDPIEALRYE